jgi:hypothetical protein
MNDAHHPPLFETRFLSDGPQEFPRPSILPRLLHLALSFIAVCGFCGVVIWAVSKGLGNG